MAKTRKMRSDRAVRKIERILNTKNIVHNLNVKIHRDTMQIGSFISSSKNRCFNIRLKMSEKQIAIHEILPQSNSFVSESITNAPTQRILRKIQSVAGDLVESIKPKMTVAQLHQRSIYKLTETAWRHCKSNYKQEVSEGRPSLAKNDVVMAKLKGWSAWPAIILDFVNKNRVKVKFYGVGEEEQLGFVEYKEISPFEISAEVIKLLLNRNDSKFKRAVREAEIVNGIPAAVSLTLNHK